MASEPATYLDQTLQREDRSPTEPVDYAALNAIYGALLSALVLTTRNKAAREDPITGAELVPMAAATFALAKVIARERIGAWVREPFVEDPKGLPRPRGRRMKRAIGELVTCTRCVGAWSALSIVGLRLGSPAAGRIVTNVLAVSAANDWLQAGFRFLCAKTEQR